MQDLKPLIFLRMRIDTNLGWSIGMKNLLKKKGFQEYQIDNLQLATTNNN